jgi:hypothetical protein
MVSRNMPFIELLNDGDATAAPITQLHMTIGNTQYHFADEFLGDFALLGTTTPDVQIQSSIASGGDELIIDILNGGLLPGDLLRFKIDIDPDVPSGGTSDYADYRNVLFNMGGTTVQDTAMAWVTYNTGESYVTSDHAPFQDLTGVDLQSTSTRVSAASTCCCSGPGGQPLYDPNRYVATGGITAVPEPGSIVLCLIGLVGGVGFCRRHRARVHRG